MVSIFKLSLNKIHFPERLKRANFINKKWTKPNEMIYIHVYVCISLISEVFKYQGYYKGHKPYAGDVTFYTMS